MAGPGIRMWKSELPWDLWKREQPQDSQSPTLSLIMSSKVRDKAQDSGVPKRNNLPLDPMNVVLCDVFFGLERMWESCMGKWAESFPVSEDGSSPAGTTAETQELPLWAQGSNI